MRDTLGPRTSLGRIERTPSLTERVYVRLRDSIVAQALAPGEPIVIEELAALLGVSRTPIREALPALLQLGLIEEAAGGFRVAPVDATYVWETYAVRSALESLAAEIVAPLLQEADLQALREVVYGRTPHPEGDYAEFLGPDVAFHDLVLARCPLGYLNSLITSVQVHRRRLRYLEERLSRQSRQASYAEHRAILAALERHDGRETRRLMQEHLDRIGTEVAALAEGQPGPEPVEAHR